MNALDCAPSEEKTLRPYQPPAILAELELETRAGSPLGSPEELPEDWLE